MSATIVVRAPDDPVTRFAVEELAFYASVIAGEAVSQGEPAPGTNLLLEINPSVGSGDAFLLRSTATGLTIASATSRGILHGVYAYLESLGVRFPFPGREHEVIPRRDLNTDGYERLEVPAFARRGMTFSGDVEHARGWIDFCGKHRLNWVFHHTGSDEWWSQHRDVLWPELQKRGISLELGGHFLPRFLPRDLFAEHPDWFRFVDGERRNDHNLCPSSRPALEYLQERVRAYVRAMPEAEVYNVWADDTAEDATTWCACEHCRGYSPSDQNLIVMNALARAVRDVKPAARMVCIAYHETIAPPEKVEPDQGIVLMFAPRERCYAHALDDPSCAKNREHARWLENLLKVFDPEATEIFEYYPDQVVFNHMAPALADTISGDVRYYHGLGIGLVEPLLTTFTHPWLSPPAAAILQSHALWNVNADLRAALEDHARTYYGDEAMVAYFEHRERALQRAVAACDFTHPVAAFWTPPIDRPGVTARHIEGLERSLDDLRLARAALADAGRRVEDPYRERIVAEARAFDLAGRRVNGQIHFARGLLAYDRYTASHRPEDARAAIGHFEHAYADLNEILVSDGRLRRTFPIADRYIQQITRDFTPPGESGTVLGIEC